MLNPAKGSLVWFRLPPYNVPIARISNKPPHEIAHSPPNTSKSLYGQPLNWIWIRVVIKGCLRQTVTYRELESHPTGIVSNQYGINHDEA